MSLPSWTQRLASALRPPSCKLTPYFSAVGLVVSGVLVERLAFRLDPEHRIVVIFAALLLLANFLVANVRPIWQKLVVGFGCCALAILAQDGALVAIGWLLLVMVLTPESPRTHAVLVRVSVVILILYLLLIRNGMIAGWDDRQGREWSGALAERVWKVRERSTFVAVVGPWLLLWSGCLLAVASAKLRQSRRGLVALVSTVVWLAPILLSLALLNPMPLIVSVALLALGAHALVGADAPREPNARVPLLRLGLAGGLLMLLAGGSILTRHHRTQPLRSVAIAPVGLGTTTPEQGPPVSTQQRYEANFSRLSRFLMSQGAKVTVLKPDWTKGDLQGHQTVLFVNPQKLLAPSQLKDLYAAVADGVRLVVASDHSDIMGVMRPTNQLLQPVPIRLRFDTAMPFASNQEWHKAMWLHPAMAAITRNSPSLSVSVGASLMIWGDSEPLVVGHRGFADPGNRANSPGFLSNMTYDIGEPVYGVPLVAQVPFGKGSVVCLGDTSPLQATALTDSGAFVLGLITPKPSMSDHTTLAGLTALIGAAVIMGCEAALGTLPFASSLLIMALLALQNGVLSRMVPTLRVSESVVLDQELRPRFPGSFPDQKLDKLVEMSERQGLELVSGAASRAMNGGAKAILINAPTRVPAASLVGQLSDYVQSGGRLLVVCGRQHRDAGNRLLAPFGLSLADVPLGGVDTTAIVDQKIRHEVLPGSDGHDHRAIGLLIDACEITGGGEVVARTLGRATIVRKSLGKGFVIVVGDSRFLTSKCLGESLKLNVAPARLCYALLKQISH